MATPIELFISYSHQDERLKNQLDDHLSPLKREGIVSIWHDRRIAPGREWSKEIDDHLNRAHLVLLLVSAKFMASDYCFGIEMQRALERHNAGHARVIPIILRPVAWEQGPLGILQALPTNAKPVVQWKSRDEAFKDIVAGIRRAITDLFDTKALLLLQTPVATSVSPFLTTTSLRPYLKWLCKQTATIDFLGLSAGAGRPHSFPIDEFYIPLTTRREALSRESDYRSAKYEPMELEDSLTHRQLLIVGDPGSGKTTFLRRIAFAMASAALEEQSGTTEHDAQNDTGQGLYAKRLLPVFQHAREAPEMSSTPPLPVLFRIDELIKHIESCRQQNISGPSLGSDSPDWLIHFLATSNAKFGWGLTEEVFAERLADGNAVILVDGLDEAPDRAEREHAAQLFQHATLAYQGCRFVVTTRPLIHTGGILLDGFHEARIEPLTPEAVDTFLDLWCRRVYADSARTAEDHRKELSLAICALPEIRILTPAMLIAMAVLHSNERHLPMQQADLFDSILIWLSRQRERPGREKSERCLTLLEVLALAMQNHPKGRQVTVPIDWAAKALARQFGHAPERELLLRAKKFLEQEAIDSGIIVNRGDDLQFWHLTFQEHMAARAIAGLPKLDQIQLLLREEKIFRPEWREVALPLAGILVKQGMASVDGLVSAILDRTNPELVDQARAAGLLGAIVNNLKPLNYQPSDSRYRELMEAVLRIFDLESVRAVEFVTRLEAAEALGQWGDLRLRQGNWVRIEGYEIGRYPVTVVEYARFVEEGGYQNKRLWREGGFAIKQEPGDWQEQKRHPNRPVVRISWYEASAYCAWAGVRLLSEGEWERAARGTEGREHPWGNQEPDAMRANYAEGGPGAPTPVGLYPAGATPEPEGVQDLVGNVWEWVEDWYEKDKVRVAKGGSWVCGGSDMRATALIRVVPDARFEDFGFRVARDCRSPD